MEMQIGEEDGGDGQEQKRVLSSYPEHAYRKRKKKSSPEHTNTEYNNRKRKRHCSTLLTQREHKYTTYLSLRPILLIITFCK